MSRKSKSTVIPELTAEECTDVQQLGRVAARVEDIWRTAGASEDDLNRPGRRLPSEIAAGIDVSESQYCAAIVQLLWEENEVEDDDLLRLMAGNRDWLCSARDAGIEVDEVAQFLSEKIATRDAETTPDTNTPTHTAKEN